MGHTLALQYGGSEAHAVFFQRKKGEWEAATQGKDLFTSIRWVGGRAQLGGVWGEERVQGAWAAATCCGTAAGSLAAAA
jgi:hypothetical protein